MGSDVGEHRKLVKLWDVPGAAHFFTCSCLRRQAFLTSERACGYLAEAIDGGRRKFGFHVWAYVFMPEHFHCLVWFPGEEHVMSAVVRAVKQSVAYRVVCYLEKENPAGLARLETGRAKPRHSFWQAGPGYDRNIFSLEELEEKFLYIHNNPVKRGLVSSPEAWKWSSFRAWNGGENGPIAVDRESFPNLKKLY